MNRNVLNEDQRVQKLSVFESPQLKSKIDDVIFHNRFDEESLNEWLGDIKYIESHLSNRVIAFNIEYKPQDNGIIWANIFGHDVAFAIKEDDNGVVYVFIFDIELRPDDFGLRESYSIRREKSINRINNLFERMERHTKWMDRPQV